MTNIYIYIHICQAHTSELVTFASGINGCDAVDAGVASNVDADD